MNTILIGGEAVVARMDVENMERHLPEADRLQELNIPSICDDCVNRGVCAKQKKACSEFSKFVDTIPGIAPQEEVAEMALELAKDGSDRVPTKAEYKKHFVL